MTKQLNQTQAQLTAYRLIIGEIYARKERYPLSVDAEAEIAAANATAHGTESSAAARLLIFIRGEYEKNS